MDAISRPAPFAFGSERDREGWGLSEEAFRVLDAWAGGLSIDRFASRVNNRLGRYNSKVWEPEAILPAGAFAHGWRMQPDGQWEWNYCFPPHHLVSSCVRHARECRAWMLVVVPLWKSQAWWPVLMRSAQACARLGRSDRLLQRLEGGRWEPVARPPFEYVAVICDFRWGDDMHEQVGKIGPCIL